MTDGAMMTFGIVAPRLAANGYLPIPIKPGTKRPPMAGWPMFRLDDAALAEYRQCGTGLLCGQLIAIDIDVLHETAAAELHKLARLELGDGPSRIGQAPKLLVVFRTATLFRKQQTPVFLIDGAANKVEVLASGQQFVSHAIHPGTQKPYAWPDSDLLDVPFADLTEVSETQIVAFILKAAAVLGKYGKPEKPEKPDRANGGEPPREHHRADDDPARRAYAEAALAGEVKAVATAGRHSRNNALNVAAMKLGQLVAGGWLDQSRVERSLEDAASASGLARDDGIGSVRATIKSGLDAGMREPRDPPERQGGYRGNGATQPSYSHPANDAFSPESEPPSWQDDTGASPIPHLSEALWIARPVLGAIREYAHSRICSGEAESAPPSTRGVVINFPAWQGRPLPEREWLIPNWLPVRHVTSLYGDGGTGKSLLAQQLMTASAIGSRWLGLPAMRCPTFGLFCEDHSDDLLLRQQDINEDLGINFVDLADMHIWALAGEDALLMTFDHRGRGELTELWHELRRRVLDCGARLLVVDTAADTFGGNEIVRSQVRYFIRACLGRLAIDMNGAVLLCAHPSRSGLATGEGDGGSTAWSNSVRSRLFFARPDDGTNADPDARVLTRKKANYAARGDEIKLIWRNGLFVPEGAPAGGVLASIEKRNGEGAFLEALEQATAAGRNLSDSRNAGNYAPRVLQQTPAGRSFKVQDFEHAMNRLFGNGQIRMVPYGRPSKGTTRIERIV